MAKSNSYTIKEVVEHYLTDMQNDLREIKVQTIKTNGRVNSLERSRLQIWTSICILLFVGGAIITLSVMAINHKITDGIDAAFNERCGEPCVVPMEK